MMTEINNFLSGESNRKQFLFDRFWLLRQVLSSAEKTILAETRNNWQFIDVFSYRFPLSEIAYYCSTHGYRDLRETVTELLERCEQQDLELINKCGLKLLLVIQL